MTKVGVTPKKWNICKLEDIFDWNSFDCEVPELNDYLKKSAIQYKETNFAITYVATECPTDNKVLGYYCTSTGSVRFQEMPDKLTEGCPNHPIPVIRIGRLAVDKRIKGQGLGKELLFHALLKSLKLSEETGICACVVDAKNEEVKKFYKKYGFIELKKKSLTLVLPISTIKNSL